MADFQIIAEAAQGFEGKAELASLLVKAAAAAKADAIKFQLVYADELATPDYQHYALFKTLEMPDTAWRELKALADQSGVALYLDVFGSRSLALAQALGCRAVKVHSTDMANPGLLQEIAESDVPLVLLSSAGCSEAEIEEALALFARKEVVLLHGFQGYPTPTDANHLARIAALRKLLERSGVKGEIGFADHAPADDPLRFLLPAAAMGGGARVIEKHLTLSKVMAFEDHEAALSPDELAEFVVQMRACFAAIGVQDAMHASELDYRTKTRKHVVALKEIEAGSTIDARALGLLRTSSADPIYAVREVSGKRAKSRIAKGSAVVRNALEDGQ
jgi:N,N'-diacetyllegionaminate synthase